MHEVMDAWKEAYRKANGKEPPEITYNHGWFSVNFSKYRRKDIEKMTRNLLSRIETSTVETTKH